VVLGPRAQPGTDQVDVTDLVRPHVREQQRAVGQLVREERDLEDRLLDQRAGLERLGDGRHVDEVSQLVWQGVHGLRGGGPRVPGVQVAERGVEVEPGAALLRQDPHVTLALGCR